ncbi:hypothetical protein BJF78_13105 [Pseudonocardia sp. CNS-139]|nr:hypothetical protein BJF78_13105 [Pseudonocardia sp. CNS-139]
MAIVPSATALTRTPCGPYSTASARVSPSTAAFAMTYGAQPGTARWAWCEETLTIAPPVPAARNRRTAVAQEPFGHRAPDTPAASRDDVAPGRGTVHGGSA